MYYSHTQTAQTADGHRQTFIQSFADNFWSSEIWLVRLVLKLSCSYNIHTWKG